MPHQPTLDLQMLFDDASQAIFVQSAGCFAYVNRAALRLFGAGSREQLLGRPILHFVHRDLRDEVGRRIRQVNEEQVGAGAAEFTYLRLDGTAIPVEVFAIPMLHEGRPGAVVCAIDVAERTAVQDALRESEEYYRTLFERSPFPMLVFEPGSARILAVNSTACQHYGYAREEFLQLSARDLRPRSEVESFNRILANLEPGDALRTDVAKHRKKSGTLIDVEVVSQNVGFRGAPARLVIVKDVTESRRLEQQFLQAQKMDAVGQLAGGIAHDFNNLLTVINNCAALAADEVGGAHAAHEHLEAIAEAGARAASLTSQLLAFSRKQVQQPWVLSLNDIVSGIEPMLRRLLGEDIDLAVTLRPEVHSALVDWGQVEQVLVNLAVNARDAMPKGGRLTIETSNADLDEAYVASRPGIAAGPHALLSVTDDGCGMDAATQARLFEPFFTTKPAGKGTGLGLSTVYGIVKQSGGHIAVYSEPGTGTTFRVYLPAAGEEATQLPPCRGPRTTRGGSESILIVEDEPQVRAVAKRILARAGYTVVTAAGPAEALALASDTGLTVDALITDIVMPEMGGAELAGRLAAFRPRLKVLYMSGYTETSIVHHGVLDPGLDFLGKPFTAAELTARVREVLDRPASR